MPRLQDLYASLKKYSYAVFCKIPEYNNPEIKN